jgi:hypothetical protein
LTVCAAAGAEARYSANPGVPWPATDGLGRTLPLAADAGAPRPDRFVGIFYFLWLGQHDRGADGPYVVTDILRRFPGALKSAGSPPWGPAESPHYWGEPLYGFYRSDDPWVLRRHAWLLADAGVDTLIFDTTNRITYRDVYFRLCEVFRQVRREGGRTPQIVFMVNTEAGATAQDIYEDLYQPRLYEELWFQWKGKPLLIADPAKVSPEVREFFTLRRAHWPFTQVNTQDAWHWEAAFPQVYGFSENSAIPEQVNVSVAQNLRIADGKVTDMSNGDARGRSFHNGAIDRGAGAVNYGYNFGEQWTRALELAPPFVMVTGWNEWIAGRFTRPGKPVVFVDQFDEEHSRDIEMMKGGHLDHYYYQLIANVRRYKGVPALRTASGAKSMDADDGFAGWRDVLPEFRDHIGETAARDFGGVSRRHYKSRGGVNDLELMKVARDKEKVFFYARTRDAVVRPGDGRMMLLIDVAGASGPAWEGYRFAINRAGAGVLERCAGAGKWERVADVGLRVSGNELDLAIPRAALGIGTGEFTIDFKWLDGAGDVMEWYESGDAAPEGRFRYRYAAKP